MTHVVLATGRVVSRQDWHTRYKFQGHQIVYTGSYEDCLVQSQIMYAAILAEA